MMFRVEALPIFWMVIRVDRLPSTRTILVCGGNRSEEHTSELHHGYISYAVFCLKKKKTRLNFITVTYCMPCSACIKIYCICLTSTFVRHTYCLYIVSHHVPAHYRFRDLRCMRTE